MYLNADESSECERQIASGARLQSRREKGTGKKAIRVDRGKTG